MPNDLSEPTVTSRALLVTVVIPTFHREELVVQAVRSALSQAGVTVEVIVVDDSAEGSAEEPIAAMAEPRVRYVRRQKETGGNPAIVRNEGLALARGTYVHFLDADDLLEEGALAATVGALEKTPSVGVAVGIVVPFGDDPAALRHEEAYFALGRGRLRAARWRLGVVTHMLFDQTPMVNSACTIRRSCAVATGGYSPAVRIVEDVDFYLRAIRRSGFVFVDRPVVRYRTGTPSLMHSLRDKTVVPASYREIYAQYRRERGFIEFATLWLVGMLRRAAWRVTRYATSAVPTLAWAVASVADM
jgi:glycosyltransferase involved in cell wall biosynthesis